MHRATHNARPSPPGLTKVVMTACLAVVASGAAAQGPAAGVVGGAIARFQELNETGPGWIYYGVNAADRGLGYNGGYMTLGGFFPTVQDDLGGIWSADVRSHLSEFGGFFSNVGAVRKQFIGGTLLGFGVYWDYDGDLNQYPTGGAVGTGQFGQFGHAYNQVGVSGEWLTDWGNLRSNGYIPVGQTASTAGAPDAPFVNNWLLCQYGLDAALGGADLEVGAYLPGLTDWAGMVSVGGYALGNDRYVWGSGSRGGQAVVPWFGGVYTRLDMTLLRNWDFSLQANNDSYFDWTGFARLTYRMGGSRRRNVADQMEQPMMRNEHVVRAHQTPVVAINPATGDPWRVFHVDSAAAPGGNGSAESPFQLLTVAQTNATLPYDIVFVRPGVSGTTPYVANWQFQADNQILVGAGSNLQLATASCGFRQFFNRDPVGGPEPRYPRLTANGTAVTLREGALVDHFEIVSTDTTTVTTGIFAGPAVTTAAYVNDVRVIGNNGVGEVGVELRDVDGRVQLGNMRLVDTGRGLLINGGSGDVNFQGLIESRNSPGESVIVQNKSAAQVEINVTAIPLDTPLFRNTSFTTDFAITSVASTAPAVLSIDGNTNTTVDIGTAQLTNPAQRGVVVQNNIGTFVTLTRLTVADAGAEAFLSTGNDANTTIQLLGENRLSSLSSTVPAFRTAADFANIAATVKDLGSAVPPGTNNAIVIGANSTGFLTVTDSFRVGPAPGTPGSVAADVTNDAGAAFTVTVP